MEAGTPESGGGMAMLTVMVVVAGFTQACDEVNVTEMLPLRPVGLNVLPLTPVPDQVPVG